MKKLFGLVLVLMFVFSVNAFAIDWIMANEKTVGWSASTLENGGPVPEDNVIQYKVFVANAVTDPDKTNPVEVGTTESLEYTLTLNVEGKYLPGVQAIRIIDGEEVSNSIIAWSDNPVVCKDEKTFGIKYSLGLLLNGLYAH
jgi:hypothetical protein